MFMDNTDTLTTRTLASGVVLVRVNGRRVGLADRVGSSGWAFFRIRGLTRQPRGPNYYDTVGLMVTDGHATPEDAAKEALST